MKVSEIYIEGWRQFKDFKLDLTYPKGHEKEGKPLDKVCFIGQSGTGKTTLLDILYRLNLRDDKTAYPFYLEFGRDGWIKLDEPIISNIGNPTAYKKGAIISPPRSKNDLFTGAKRVEGFDYEEVEKAILAYFKDNPGGMIYSPIDIASHEFHFDHNEIEDSNKFDFQHIPLTNDDARKTWEIILKDVAKYQEKVSTFYFKIAQEVENGRLEESEQIAANLKKWKKENPGILEDLAQNFLDPILANFNLQVFQDLVSINDVGFLQVETFQGGRIPERYWSTGIKNIIYKTIALFSLEITTNHIILIDEPENSLYPDIQAQIIDHYTRLAPDSQFFFATHSPIVASSFEPWEIVELKFNEEGNVYRELYFEGENHIDNYSIYPQRLTYGDIYREVFDLETTAHPQRELKMKEAEKKRAEALRLKKEGNEQAAQKEYKEYQDLADTLNWRLNEGD